MTDAEAVETRLDALEARFEARISDLEDDIDRLEEELESEREQRRTAERALASVERELEGRVDFLQTDVWELEDVVFGSMDAAAADAIVRDAGSVFTRLDTVETRIEDVARGEVDASELAAQHTGPSVEDLIPLHQVYASATNQEPHQHELTSNQEIAARLFPHLAQYATPSGDELHLSSSKLRDVIEREICTPELSKRLDVAHPNRNTIKRVMEFIGRFSDDIMEFAPASSTDRRNSKNLIIIDRDAWTAYTEHINNKSGGPSPSEPGSGGHEVRADGGNPSVT